MPYRATQPWRDPLLVTSFAMALAPPTFAATPRSERPRGDARDRAHDGDTVDRPARHATVKALLTSISFVAQRSRGTSAAKAYLHLEDDADCHKYKIAVPSAFARSLAKKVEDEEFDDAPSVVLLATSILLGSDESAPSLAQLTALRAACSFIDYKTTCPICRQALPRAAYGEPPPACPDAACPGTAIRRARADTPVV